MNLNLLKPFIRFRSRKDFVYVFPNEPLMRDWSKNIFRFIKKDFPLISLVDHSFYNYFLSKKLVKEAHSKIFSFFKNNPQSLVKLFSEFKKGHKRILALGEKLEKVSLFQKEEVLKIYKKFINAGIKVAAPILTLWILIFHEDLLFFKILKNILKKKFKKTWVDLDLEEAFKILIEPREPSAVFNERQDLFKILKKIDQKTIQKIKTAPVSQLRNYLQRNKKLNSLIQAHLKNYFWIPFEYLGPYFLTDKDILKSLKEILKNKNWQEEASRYLVSRKEREKRKAELFKRLALNKDEVSLFNLASFAQMFFETRKEYFTKWCIFVFKFYQRLAKDYQLKNYRDLYWLTKEEVEDFIQSGKLDEQKIENRKKLVVYIHGFKKFQIFEGEKAYKIFSLLQPKETQLKELKGTPTFILKQKIKGKVQIIISPKEVKRFKKGNILVTQMTNPAFMIALKKARAIITDEGGITSHAAIVSRELKIPCIIGTKIATKVLNDGDKVEVDANKGIVKIINK